MIQEVEKQINKTFDRVNVKLGTKEIETGLASPAIWDLEGDRKRADNDNTLQVASVCKIVNNENGDDNYMINLRQMAKFIVGKGVMVDKSLIEEGMRVGVDRMKYQILLPLLRKIDASVTLMQVEEKPNVTYDDIGGCKEQI